MIPEELRAVRYQVIAPYPLSPYSIDEIIPVATFKHAGVFIEELERYPHLFHRMDWWDAREKEDMPEYVKSILTNEVYRVEEHFVNNMPTYRYLHMRIGAYQYCIPVTEEEYILYLETHKLTQHDS